jgi:outer membrane protein TolC
MKLKFRLQKCPCLPLVVGVACVCRLGPAAQPPELATTSPPSPTNVVLTLNSALQLALANNPELRASSARIDAAAGRAYQAKLWSNPDLELSGEDWPTGGGG